MDDYQLLIDLHKQGRRQGPGGDAETEQALRLAKVDGDQPWKVADIGCGTGASTLVLAKRLNAQITAVDFLEEFLDVLNERAKSEGVADKISPIACSMDDLPFADEEFDLNRCGLGKDPGLGATRLFADGVLRASGTLLAGSVLSPHAVQIR